jgi:hypothetical protein
VINPDFSQVESDAPQISANTTFALYYPEKRPFFLEGTDIFSTWESLFYTRMINDPLVAAKLTAKSGAWSYGYLGAIDRHTQYIVPGEEGSDAVGTSTRSAAQIARVRRDFGNESYAGALATARGTGSAYNVVGGADWNARFAGHYYARGLLLFSRTREIRDTTLFAGSRAFAGNGATAAFDGETYSGALAYAAIKRSARNYNFTISYNDASPTFQAQEGFITSTGTRQLEFDQEYVFYPANAVLDQISGFVNAFIKRDYRGRQKERVVFVGSSSQWKAQTTLWLAYLAVNDEIFHDVQYRWYHRVFFDVSTRPLGSLTIRASGQIGRFIHRVDTPELGDGHTLTLGVDVKPNDNAQISLEYSRASLSGISGDGLLLDGYVAQMIASYQFSPELFARLIGEYNAFDKSTSIFPLISYKLNPFTIFYAGATSNAADFGSPWGFRETERQYFVKLQYLIRA